MILKRNIYLIVIASVALVGSFSLFCMEKVVEEEANELSELDKIEILASGTDNKFEDVRIYLEKVLKWGIDQEAQVWSCLWLAKNLYDKEEKEKADEYLDRAVFNLEVTSSLASLKVAVTFLKMHRSGQLSSEAIMDVLHNASANGWKRVMVFVVTCIPADVKNELFFRAAKNGQINLCEILLDSGAEVNSDICYGTSGGTPLHVALMNGDKRMVEFLLVHNADVNQAREYDCVTPLHIAAESGSRELVEILLAHGAEVNAQCDSGRAPLFGALIGDDVPHGNYNEEVVAILLLSGADTRIRGSNGMNVWDFMKHIPERYEVISLWPEGDECLLHLAAYYGFNDRVEALLDNGLEVSKCDRHGYTPLHYALKKGHDEVVDLLIARGATISIKDTGIVTAMYLVPVSYIKTWF